MTRATATYSCQECGANHAMWCVRCDDCERLYHDQQKCVHWIVLRKKPLVQTAAS